MIHDLFNGIDTSQCTRDEKRDKGPLALVILGVYLAEKVRHEDVASLEDCLPDIPLPLFRDLVRMVIDDASADMTAHHVRMVLKSCSPTGVDALNALVASEAVQAIQSRMAPLFVESLLCACLGPDADLYYALVPGSSDGLDRSQPCRLLPGIPADPAQLAGQLLSCRDNARGAGFNDREPFDFDDLVQLDDRSIQKILREIDSTELAKALKGASREVKDKIFRNMSQRASKLLQEDMDYMGPIRVMDVRIARDGIIAVMRRLEALGEIILIRSADNLMVE